MAISKKFISNLLSVIIFYLCSCSTDDTSVITGSGFVNLNLNINTNIINNTDVSFITPHPDEFKITMSNVDGTHSQSWTSFSQFPQDKPLKVGTYLIEAGFGNINEEGFESPYYAGQTTIQVIENNTTEASIDCKLANTMVSIEYTEEFKNFFDDFSSLIHSEGGSYIKYSKDETRPLYVKPGKVSLILSLTKKNGISATFQPAEINNALAQHHYHITFDINSSEVGKEELIITFDDNTISDNVTICLSDKVMSSPGPQITTKGFSNNETITINDGDESVKTLSTIITSSCGLKELTLTTQSKSLIEAGFPNEIELVNANTSQENALTSLGLNVNGIWDGATQSAEIDFTNLLTNISAIDNSDNISTFTIVAKDKYSKVNNPVTFHVSINPIEFSLKNTPQSIIGINKTNITLSSTNPINPNKLDFEILNEDNSREKCNINKISKIDETTYSIDLTIPHGVKNANLNIIYNGIIKQNINITRVQPKFSIEVDAFANKALIRINAEDDSLTEVITNNLSVYANDIEPAILGRNTTYGIISVSGLKPETAYLFKATMMKGNPEAVYSNIVKINTESKLGVPDGDFEDVKERINRVILSGGKYSQTHMPIYNQQNKTEIIVSTPKKDWATVNAKTFNESASNINTWYLQPSTMTIYDAVSGSKAIKLSSVAWDPKGEAIPDYAQTPGEYVPYNKNIPNISYRAAGKLFLGEYNYNATNNSEVYTEGISFNSRPTALNGYYKYTPGINQLHDKGIVIISIINRTNNSETEIAHGEFLFSGNSDYTAFNVPLSYKSFGIKATHLKIMLASTSNIGSIQDETMKIITTDNVSTASSIGSSLWIDNLTFSY